LVPDADQERREAFHYAEMRARPFVFSGASLPPCDFAEPSLVEDLVGPYSVRATYYSRDYHAVTSAVTPGRYGAVVQVETRDMGPQKRYVTLFRTQDPVPWRSGEWRFTAEFPGQIGIPADVLREQPSALTEGLKGIVTSSFRTDQASAVLLASLDEAGACGRRARAWTDDGRWWYGLRKQLGDLQPLGRLLFVPRAYGDDTTREWPLLLFLHGAGERGDNLELVKVHGPPKIVQTKPDFPFILVSPQCPAGEWWSPWALRDLVEQVCTQYRVDRSRLYVTGLSMGGYGTWDIVAEFPDMFAAAVPICGGGDPTTAPAIARLPVWVFHGGKDPVVPLDESANMVKALRDLGSSVRFTVYPDADHDSWTQTYNNPEVYRWLLEQRRATNASGSGM